MSAVLPLSERVKQARAAGYTPTQMARAAGKSTSAVAQWESGLTKALSGEAVAGLVGLTGWSADWWAHGRGPRERGGQPVTNVTTGVQGAGAAHSLTEIQAIIAPIELRWEALLSAELPSRFSLVIRDDSMPPMAPGGRAHFVPASKPAPNKIFLWADQAGNALIRRCVEAMPGQWIAAPDAPSGYAPLDVAASGLRVVAAFRGYTWDEPAD